MSTTLADNSAVQRQKAVSAYFTGLEAYTTFWLCRAELT